MTEVLVTPANFMGHLTTAKPGSINQLRLSPGVYPTVSLRGISNLLLTGASGAYLQTMNLSNCHNVTLNGVTFVDHVGNGYGFNALDSSDITLDECEFDGGYEHAFVAGRVTRLSLTRSKFHNFTSDAVDLVNVWHFLLDSLKITDPKVDLSSGVHPDAIQLRSSPFNPNNYFEKWAPTSDGVISNCVIDGVPMQGIALTNHIRDWKARAANPAHGWPELPALYGVDDGGMARIAARKNHIRGGGRALSMTGPTCVDCEMTDNVIETHPDSTQQALFAYTGATRMTAHGNTAGPFDAVINGKRVHKDAFHD